MTNRPSSTYRELEIPPTVADQLQTAFALPRPPTTLGDWVTITSAVAEDVGLTVGMETLCTTETSRHEATIDDETRYFHCVLDALVIPFLRETDEPVTIRSESPVSGTVVEIQAGQDSLTVDPPDALMSFGVAIGVDASDADDVDLSLGYEWFCPYTNAFLTGSEYEEWDLQIDAVTMAIPIDISHQLASDIPDFIPANWS